MKKIGILGGTFNPIHKGHLALGKEALKVFGLEKVFFIPAGNPYHKENGYPVSSDDRLKMVTLALNEAVEMIPLDIDIKRQGPTYTIDTIDELEQLEPDSQFYVILGSDAYQHIQDWHGIEPLAQKVFFIVAIRGGADEMAWRLFVKTMPDFIREKTLLLPLKPYYISSTVIREKGVQKSKKKLPKKVYDFICEKGLYKNDI